MMPGPGPDQVGHLEAGLDEGEYIREAWLRGLRTLFAVSEHMSEAPGLPRFFGALTATIAHLTSAERAAFWALQADGMIAVQPEAHGFQDDVPAALHRIPAEGAADDAAYTIVTGDPIWSVARKFRDDPPANVPWLDVPGVRDGVVVPWRVGDQRLGLLGVYDSRRPGGFTESDVWVARVASLAAGVVWQEQQSANRLLEIEREQTARIREHADRISALEKIKSNVLNLAAHELRGPLAVIRGYLSMLEDGSLTEPEEISGVWPILNAKADQIATLVDQMLETARMEDGRIELKMEQLDLREVLQGVIDAAGPRLAPGQWLVVQAEPKPVPVVGDRLRLSSILTNLVDNAIKYTPNGGPIQCSVVTERGASVVRVIDRGLGIAEADMPTLFTRFGRIINSENSSVPGTGLGLFLCRELALMHGGDIVVESEPGVGSAFDLVLPEMDASSDGAADGGRGGYDLAAFGLGDMIRCSAALRRLGRSSNRFNQAAQRLVRHLYDNLLAGERGERAAALVRMFRAQPYSRLNTDQREIVRAALGRVPEPALLCLSLVGTAGAKAEWNRVLSSARHRVIPLVDAGRLSPMAAELFSSLGVDPSKALDPDVFVDLIEKTCNVFHVADAFDSPYVPDQEAFVKPYGISSVLGFGGVLTQHDMYAVVIFSKTPIGRGSAALFRSISHSARLALQPFVGAQTPASGPPSGAYRVTPATASD